MLGRHSKLTLLFATLLFVGPIERPADAQTSATLDPSHDVTHPALEGDHHQTLPEEYIWTPSSNHANGKVDYRLPEVNERIDPHYFRKDFRVDTVPSHATLYVAGPRSVRAWMNGQPVGYMTSDVNQPLSMHVFRFDVSQYLHQGSNTVALEVVRGRGVIGFSNNPLIQQQTFGEVVVAKILDAEPGDPGRSLVISDNSWQSSTQAKTDWQMPDIDNGGWQPAQSIGAIESTSEFFQWNADAGMYDWPGYDGISPYLATLTIPVAHIVSHYDGRGSLHNIEALNGSAAGEFSVSLQAGTLSDEEAPTVVLDFGKELAGRLEIASDSDTPSQLTVQYGESLEEMMRAPYIGINLLTIPAHAVAHGPKTSFRYAMIRFVGGDGELHFKSITTNAIYYPVQYVGAFESSDPMLNKIWETGAYTVHLCMQDDIWDAPKRDRGQWMGDTEVMEHVISDVFGDTRLLEQTLDRLLGKAPVEQHVNGIAGYSAAWFTGAADYYRHSGSVEFLQRMHPRMLQLLHVMDSEFDKDNLFANNTKQWLFVDWSPELNGNTTEATHATQMEFVGAFRQAAWLLREVGDVDNAQLYEERAKAVASAAERHFETANGAFGDRWQTNAAAVISGVAEQSQYPAIWANVLSHVGHVHYSGLTVSPYYGGYILRAMAQMDHRKEALDWMRTYWGGMIAEGATSFWEAYDPDWFKDDFHASLQADNLTGYRISLAHGWSSTPTSWLMEEVLGLHIAKAGSTVFDIRPDLLGLAWAKGSQATSFGPVDISIATMPQNEAAMHVELTLPNGIEARVAVPVSKAGAKVLVNGTLTSGTISEGGARTTIDLKQGGHYILQSE